MLSSVAIYARISSDQEGAGLGVARQLEDCRRVAAELGWIVGDEYVDNDVSAYSGKRRPEYQRMLEDLAGGLRDGVVVYHPDRLTRRPIELEQFMEVLSATKVRHVRFVTGGDLDVGNGDGLLVMRMLSAVAANESASKSRRVRRKLDEVAAAGRPHGGSTRPFGYEDDKLTIREDEATVVRALAARYLAGESWVSLTSWLNDEGIPTVRGREWQTSSVRGLLLGARIAGLRLHRGVVVGPAVWEPIITADQRDQIIARAESRRVSGRRSPRRYLLSGIVRCSRCSQRMYSETRGETRRYACISGPDHGGCGRMAIVAAPLEDLITDAVLYRLDTAELADALAGRSAADDRAAAVAERLNADRVQLDELAALYADRAITAREWMEARNPIESRIKDATRQLAQRTGAQALTGWVGNGQALRAAWSGLNLTRQAAIVAAVLSHVSVQPATPGARSMDPSRVEPIWRL
jgi:DNA invertase Pin-like site-specific DNA recombinase